MSINYHTTLKKLLINSKNSIFCVLRKNCLKNQQSEHRKIDSSYKITLKLTFKDKINYLNYGYTNFV